MTQTTYNFDAILQDAKDIWNTAKAGPLCPLDEVLFDYVYGDLTGKEYETVSDHIRNCERCHIEVLKMEADMTEWECSFNKNPDAVLADILGKSVPAQLKLKKEIEDIPIISKIKDSLISWLSPLWEPQWAGQTVTASDIPEQKNSFITEDGEIRISCQWQDKYKNEPAYICLSWEADIPPDKELWTRFVNPETRQILYEVCLGKILAGEEIFTSRELGFEPSTVRWAISVILSDAE